MIDWFGVFHNSLWIIGLASVLAALSYADWRRRLAIPPTSLRRALAEPGFQAAASFGLMLFCAGLALGSKQAWQIAAWTVLGLAFAWSAWTSVRQARRRPEPKEPQAQPDGDEG